MTYKYRKDKNQLYRVDASKILDIPPSYQPRICDGDMVIIESYDQNPNDHMERRLSPCYVVTVIKPLSKAVRCTLERNTVGNVPEDCLTPFEGSPLEIPYNAPVKSHKVKMQIIEAAAKGSEVDENLLNPAKMVHYNLKHKLAGTFEPESTGPKVIPNKKEELTVCKYRIPCRYCKTEINLNSAGGEIGLHDCRPGKDQFNRMKIDNELDNRQNNMLIHGFLLACRMFAAAFTFNGKQYGFESMTCYIIKNSGISKKDLIRCQLEADNDNELMLNMIERALPDPPAKNNAAVVELLEKLSNEEDK